MNIKFSTLFGLVLLLTNIIGLNAGNPVFVTSRSQKEQINNRIGGASEYFIIDQDYVPTYNVHGKVMTYNVDGGGKNPEWLDVMKEENADIALLVETGGWDENNNAVLKSNIDILNQYFQDEVNYVAVLDLHENPTSGVAILSRYPINSAVELETVTLDDGTQWNPSHDFLHANIQIGDEQVAVITAHLKCCSGTSEENKRERAQEGIINYMDSLGDIPIIYGGDMNSVYPGEPTDLGTTPVAMLVDPMEEYSSEIHIFTDVHKKLRPNDDVKTHKLGSRIDFIFVNHHFDNLLLSTTTGDTDSAEDGSIHYSVDVTMNFTNFLEITGITPSGTDTFNSTGADTSKQSDSPGFLYLATLSTLSFILLAKRKKRNR
ncbi:MAG: endonuclease/exonuclease/phosphatase family protein [Candidatus Kariarchaeaceae archaeon]